MNEEKQTDRQQYLECQVVKRLVLQLARLVREFSLGEWDGKIVEE
jgi:hypothetical protein